MAPGRHAKRHNTYVESAPRPGRSIARLMGIEDVAAGRDAYLDGVRALAVTVVLATHSWHYAGSPRFGGGEIFFATAFLWVDLFFILSACLLTRPWFVAELTGRPRPDLRKYFARRLSRIAPAYYVSIIVVLAAFAGTRELPTSAIQGSLGFWNLGSILLFLQQYVPVASRNFNGLNSPWWTLSVELTWYVILPIAAASFLYRRWRISMPIAIAVSLGWAYLSIHSLDSLVELMIQTISPRDEMLTGVQATSSVMRERLSSEIPAFAVDFAVGMSLARLEVTRQYAPDRIRRWTSRRVAIGAFMAGVFCIVGTQLVLIEPLLRNDQLEIAWYGRTPFAIGLGLCLFGMANGPRVLRRPFELTPVRFVGWVSYGVYLYHVPILIWLTHHTGSTSPIRTFLTYAGIGFALSVVAGTASWLLVERAFLVRHPRPPWAPKAAAAVIAAVLVATYARVSAREDPLLLRIDGFTENPAYTGRSTMRESVEAGVISTTEAKALEKCGGDPSSRSQTAGGSHAPEWVLLGGAFGCPNGLGRARAIEEIEDAYRDEGFARQRSADGRVHLWLSSVRSPNPDYPVRLKLVYPSGTVLIVWTIFARSEETALDIYPTVLLATA